MREKYTDQWLRATVVKVNEELAVDTKKMLDNTTQSPEVIQRAKELVDRMLTEERIRLLEKQIKDISMIPVQDEFIFS